MSAPQQRPRWAKELVTFIDDTIVDDAYEFPEDGSDDDVLDDIVRYARDRLCKRFGHEIEFDHCGIPEHRYCIWCGRRESTLEDNDN